VREGLPSLIGSTFFKQGLPNLARASGGEFLNFQFAVKPYINDIRNALRSVTESNKILNQYMRDSGRRVRRKRKFPLESSASDPIIHDAGIAFFAPGIGPLNTYLGVTDGQAYYIDASYKMRWFSGCYEYYVPSVDIDTFDHYASLANKLLGVRITPEVLWNLSPWTWMLDWFGNIGSVMTNLSYLSNDDLVIHHAYTMETQSATRKYVSEGSVCTDGVGWEHLTLETLYSHTTKQRIAAHPYGFAIDFDLGSLSAIQWEIVAALGLSRSRRALTLPIG
jgi:hypothetical protein